ncbi:DUF4253 domain-containing protein [Polaribacter undariae]|uniref:DUF4253 domain-containing protein n=1 Tax=Polaribacter sejongensis TaxID=985043 RepID=A0AAJ1VGH6_9FLAO|nr:DUF4253 domain-containing protein [Polaribacter undariae]MDN3619616.1 DUF4253 domain-containing protein [Polaribacter undariae]UWD32270.1 DUF4253 domain-containing protein [Polaribacter undariae]
MKIEKLTNNRSPYHELLFESFLIENIKSYEELMDVYQTYKQNHPDKTIILTLDDLGQAEYTSGHACDWNSLLDTEGYDLSGLDKACYDEDNEHLGHLSTPSEYFIIRENFLKQTKGIDFKMVCERNINNSEDDVLDLENMNESPLAFLDKQVILKILPVEKPYEGLTGFPNGYFNADLSPFENYALSKHLFEKYSLELFGIGASFLGFIKNEKLEENKVKELIVDLAKLYNTTESEFDKLAEIIKDKNHLFLRYTE